MADGKIQVIMDKDDLQPLADSIKALGDIEPNNELSLVELESIVNEKVNNKLKTCTVTLVNNEAGVGCGYWILKDGEPLYRSLVLPIALTPSLGDSYNQLVASLDLDKVIVGSTFWIGEGTYTSITLPVKISGACQMAPGHTSVQPGNSFGCHIIIEGDCTITYG